MADPINRQQFKDYIYRRLGYPVQQINVSDEQVDDRIDDALAFFADYHYLASERYIYKHEITQENIDDKFIVLPEHIMNVVSVLPFSGYGSGGNTKNFTSDSYQIMREVYGNMNSSISLIPYFTAMQRLSDIEYLFGNSQSFRFNKHKNQVVFDSMSGASVGQYILMDVHGVISPTLYADIWKDRWLKNYATALVKRQWGENLKLYNGVQMLNGVTLDAKTMYDEAVEDIRAMEDSLKASQMPPQDITG